MYSLPVTTPPKATAAATTATTAAATTTTTATASAGAAMVTATPSPFRPPTTSDEVAANRLRDDEYWHRLAGGPITTSEMFPSEPASIGLAAGAAPEPVPEPPVMRLLAAAVDAHCALADEVKRLASGEAPPATDDELAVAVRGLLVDVCGLQDQHWSRSELASEVTAITEARGAEASAVRRLAKGKAEALPVEAGSSDSALPPRTPMTRAMSKKLAPHTIIGRAGDVELAVFVFPGAGAYVLGGCLEQIGVKLTKRFIPNNRLTNSAELRTLAETAGRAVDTNSGAHLLGNKVLEVIGRTRPELRAKLEELVKL